MKYNKKLIWPLSALVIIFGSIALLQEENWTSYVRNDRSPSEAPVPPIEQGEIWGAHQEEITQEILSETMAVLNQKYAKESKKIPRDVHTKSHGCVKAVWNNIPGSLTHEQELGVFGLIQKPTLAWVRFSNGNSSGANSMDSNKGIRGMAIKLMTPDGSQDFTMINSERFFSRDGDDYINLFRSLNGGPLALPKYLLRNVKNAGVLVKANVSIDNLLTTRFFVPVPTKLGSQSMRLKAEPCEENNIDQAPIDKTRNNFLSETLAENLKKKSSCFHIFIQPNNDPEKNDIENPTLAWDEKKSPFIKVARLDILQQVGFNTPERTAFCENLTFSPWHTSPDLRPMGQINRIRKLVYDGISKYRHEKNQVPEIEPTNHEACSEETAALCR